MLWLQLVLEIELHICGCLVCHDEALVRLLELERALAQHALDLYRGAVQFAEFFRGARHRGLEHAAAARRGRTGPVARQKLLRAVLNLDCLIFAGKILG